MVFDSFVIPFFTACVDEMNGVDLDSSWPLAMHLMSITSGQNRLRGCTVVVGLTSFSLSETRYYSIPNIKHLLIHKSFLLESTLVNLLPAPRFRLAPSDWRSDHRRQQMFIYPPFPSFFVRLARLLQFFHALHINLVFLPHSVTLFSFPIPTRQDVS